MSHSASDDNLLARLAHGAGDNDPWAVVPTTEPVHDTGPSPTVIEDEDEIEAAGRGGAGRSSGDGDDIHSILRRVTNMLGDQSGGQPTTETNESDGGAFVPLEPAGFTEAGLNATQVEALALKYLLARGSALGRDIADQIKLPFRPVTELLHQLKSEHLVVFKAAAAMNDFEYVLTDLGCERARRYSAHCTYFGAAPVPLEDYCRSVTAQSLNHLQPTATDLERAFADLLLNKSILSRLGPAINSGRGLFLYGAPGNGKTSIAERITQAFGEYIWIPRALVIDGELVRLFDPGSHVEAPVSENGSLVKDRRIDQRWVRIQRPTIIVGGELTMDSLEVTSNVNTGISEAPIQLKSNCGTLVIDDFGRQAMRTDALLNRWIVPLEKRVDFLNLPNGKKVQVPFDQLIIFSTNLEPRDLVDDAFLRRIPYKINVADPSEEEFRELFRRMADALEIPFKQEVLDYTVKEHYDRAGRPFRCCHPRDLLFQIRNRCRYEKIPAEMSEANIDFAVENYFAVM
ncbi:MAG: AAA family ATPase [Pirellulales bacterium]